MSRSNLALAARYDQGMTHGITLATMGNGRHHGGKRPYHHHDHHHDHHGSGIMDLVRKGHAILKDRKLISKGLDSLKGMAERNGYGRRRRRRRRTGVKVIVLASKRRRTGGRRRHRRCHY